MVGGVWSFSCYCPWYDDHWSAILSLEYCQRSEVLPVDFLVADDPDLKILNKVDSTLGKGTLFTIRLPVADA